MDRTERARRVHLVRTEVGGVHVCVSCLSRWDPSFRGFEKEFAYRPKQFRGNLWRPRECARTTSSSEAFYTSCPIAGGLCRTRAPYTRNRNIKGQRKSTFRRGRGWVYRSIKQRLSSNSVHCPIPQPSQPR